MKNMRFLLLAACCMLLVLDAVAQKNKRPDSYNYQRGYEAFQDSEFDVALEYFDKELKDNAKNGYAHALTAVIHYYNDDYGRALNEVDKALKYLPKKDNEYQNMAYVTKAAVYLVLEDTTQAISTMNEGIKNYPKETPLYEKRAQILYELNRYDESDADYRKLIELSPGETIGYMGLGRNANAREQWNDAIKQFDYVTKLSSGYASGYSFRAEAYAGLKKWDEATDDIVSALKCEYDQKAVYLATTLDEPAFTTLVSKCKVQAVKTPNDAMWPTLIGFMYESKKQYDKAIEAYNTANSKDVDEAIYFRIAHCYFDMGNSQQALNNINLALNMDSTDVDNLAFKAEILNEMHDYNGAIRQMDKVLADVPEYAAGYHQRACFKKYAGDTIAAMEDLNMAVVLDPKTSWYYYTRGEIYRNQGKKDLAEADYRKVIELETKPEDFESLPYAYLGLGENDKAIAVVDTIIARDSTNSAVYYNAACVYSRMGDQPRAIAFLRKSLELGNRHFGHISRDSDLDNIRGTEEFKNLIREFEDKGDAAGETAFGMRDNMAPLVVSEIPFTKEDGVCKVKCNINGLPLAFVFDTGASEVTMSMVEATFMVKNGYLSDSDIIGSQRYMDANGNVNVGTVINLKKVEFGDLSLTNVRASVVRNQKAPLLLGQSVLGRLGKIEIDNQRLMLKITHPQE